MGLSTQVNFCMIRRAACCNSDTHWSLYFVIRTRSAEEVDQIPSESLPALVRRKAKDNPIPIGVRLSQPLLRFIPVWVTPNALTFTSLLCNIAAFAVSLVFHGLSTRGKVIALVAAGFFNLGSMVLDCLDGMHARATGQCSKVNLCESIVSLEMAPSSLPPALSTFFTSA